MRSGNGHNVDYGGTIETTGCAHNLQLTVSNIWAIRQNHCYLVPLDGADITFVLCSGFYLECSQDVQERKVGVNEAK